MNMTSSRSPLNLRISGQPEMKESAVNLEKQALGFTVELCRELYDRFVMGGWQPQDAYAETKERVINFTRRIMNGDSMSDKPLSEARLQQICEMFLGTEPFDCSRLEAVLELRDEILRLGVTLEQRTPPSEGGSHE